MEERLLRFEEFVVMEQLFRQWEHIFVQKRKKHICEQDLKHFCLSLATVFRVQTWVREPRERSRGHRDHEELTCVRECGPEDTREKSLTCDVSF